MLDIIKLLVGLGAIAVGVGVFVLFIMGYANVNYPDYGRYRITKDNLYTLDTISVIFFRIIIYGGLLGMLGCAAYQVGSKLIGG